MKIYTLEEYLKAPKSRQENKWGWYQSIYSLAGGDVFKVDKATRLNVNKAMMWLEFEKEKNDLEARLIKQSYK